MPRFATVLTTEEHPTELHVAILDGLFLLALHAITFFLL